MKPITIKDVAARANVSCATVSRVLDDHAGISDATKARVRKACDELGYVPNIAARGLVKRHTRTIGVVVPDISNPYFSGVADAIEEAARKSGYRMLVCNSMRDMAREAVLLESLMRQQVEGFIISPVAPESQTRFESMSGVPPHIYLGSNHNGHCSYVLTDNRLGAYEAARYLLSLGHRDIAYVGGREDSETMVQRKAGFLQAMQEMGLSGKVYPCAKGDNSLRRNYDLAMRVLQKKPLPTAVMAYSDKAALDFMQAADDCGIRIPEDLSLVGFDNISFSALPRINLTTVSQHKYKIGKLAVARLLEQIQGDDAEHHDVLQPELIIRATCRKA